MNINTQHSILIREATKADAAALIQYVKQVSDESQFLTFSSDEFQNTIEEEEAIIEKHQIQDNHIFLIAEQDGKIIGILNATGSYKRRLKHIATFGITVLKAHWNKGVGHKLLQGMIDWAEKSGVIRKINLEVQADNPGAIYLYEKFGFEREGVNSRASFIDGQFLDTYYMGLKID